jgi:hypothetical protein
VSVDANEPRGGFFLHGISFAPTVIDCRYRTIHSLREIDANLFIFDE